MGGHSIPPPNTKRERVALDELNKDLSAARGQIHDWAESKVKEAAYLKDKHVHRIELHKRRIAELQEEKALLRQQNEELRQRLDREHDKEASLESDIKLVEKDIAQIETKLHSLQLTVSAGAAKVEAKKAGLETEKAIAERKFSALQQAVALFQQRLGLKFVQSEDIQEELLVVFTCIDPSAHDREFIVGIRAPATGSRTEYEVTSCKPHLDDIEELRTSLNKTSDFGWFVQEVRKRFRGLC